MNTARALVLTLFVCNTSAAAIAADANPAPLPSITPALQPEIAPGAPPLPQGAQIQQMMIRMDGVNVQMRESQIALRREILAILSPVQRTMVGSLIGQLGIAIDPDAAIPARQIDALLSTGQRQAIERSVTNAFTRNEAISQQMMAQVENTIPADQQLHSNGPTQSQLHVAGSMQLQLHDRMLDALRSQSAGSIVLSVLTAPNASMFGPFPGHLLPQPK